MEAPGGLGHGQAQQAVVIACLDEWEATDRQDRRDGSRDTRETIRNRRRASIVRLDRERAGSTQKACSRVPWDRLCPSGEPNEAMAHRCPDRRMVPAYAREQDGFDVQRVVIHDRVEKDRMPRAVAGRFECDSPIRGAITWTRVPRLKTDARCQYALAGRLVGVCLDISFHRRRTNAAPSLARIRSSYRNVNYQ